MSGDLDLAGAAAVMHRSYSWFQRNWRTYRHPATGAPVPTPFVGAGKGERPWWRRAAFEAWLDGATIATPVKAAEGPTQRGPANDAAPRPPSDRVAALRAAAGG